MTAFVVSQSLEKALVVKRGTVQIEAVDAKASCLCSENVLMGNCPGIRLTALPAEMHAMEYHLRGVQDMFIERQRARGYEFTGMEMPLHGPFASYDFMHVMVDVNDSRLADAAKQDRNGDEHPELALPVVFERQENGFRDYVFVGRFIKQAELTEVILDD